MTWLRLAWSNLLLSPLTSTVNVLLMTLGTASIVLLILAGDRLSNTLTRDARGVDLVVGAEGSPAQLILSSVYHADIPPGNIPLEDAQRWAEDSRVALSAPLSLGDSFRGFRIVGTEPSYLTLFDAAVDQGAMWREPMQAVIGTAVARATGLSVGSRFSGAHGFAEDGHVHDSRPYEVVGILAPVGSVVDRLILTSLESVWLLHGQEVAGDGHHHGDDHDHGDTHRDDDSHSDDGHHEHEAHHGEDGDHEHEAHLEDDAGHGDGEEHAHEAHGDHDEAHGAEGHHEHEANHKHDEGHGDEGHHEDEASHDHDEDHSDEGHHEHDHEAHSDDDHHGDEEDHEHEAQHEHDESHGHDGDHAHASDSDHDAALDNSDLEITAMLLRYRTPLAAMSLPRQINADSSLQAAAPAMEIARILQLVGLGLEGLRAFAWVLIVTACLSVFAALYGSLRSRRGDLAMLRCLGATRMEVFLAMLSEGLILSLIGIALGYSLGHGAISAVSWWLESSRGVSLAGVHWTSAETRLLGVLIAVSVASAVIPAFQAYRTDVARTLAQGSE